MAKQQRSTSDDPMLQVASPDQSAPPTAPLLERPSQFKENYPKRVAARDSAAQERIARDALLKAEAEKWAQDAAKQRQLNIEAGRGPITIPKAPPINDVND